MLARSSRGLLEVTDFFFEIGDLAAKADAQLSGIGRRAHSRHDHLADTAHLAEVGAPSHDELRRLLQFFEPLLQPGDSPLQVADA